MTTPFDPIRNPSDERALSLGCTFDEAAARRVCDFIERFCVQSKGRWRGQPLKLLDWQRDFLWRLFGWKNPDGTRRFRRAYLEVAKKCGKSTMLSAIVLYLLLADGEGAPEVYLNACDRDQASIIYNEAASMVRSSAGLSKLVALVDYRKRMAVPGGKGGMLVTNSGEVEKQDGLNASAIIFDELHRQRTRALWDVFEYASASREQPLTISITTAGEDTLGIWHEQREYSEKVNAGTIPDVTHLGVVYRALESDDIDDPATWRKANPSLGVTIRQEDFARDLAEAKQLPVKLANFRRLRLNILGRAEGRFLEVGLWEACHAPASDPETLRGERCWMGLDLASTTDLTALATIFEADGDVEVLVKFWMPEDNLARLEDRDRVPYHLWAEAGYLILTPGGAIDEGAIRAEVVRQAAPYDLRRLCIDPWQARKLGSDLLNEDGLPVEFLRQGYASLSEPTKKLLERITTRTLKHPGNPVLDWNAGNAVAVGDAAGNIKLDKSRSRQKIDGMAALVNAIAAMTDDPSARGSVYDERDLVIL